MSISFCDIWMVGLEFGVNNISTWIYPTLFFFLFFGGWGCGGGANPTPVFLAQECFQHLGESTLKRIKAVLRAKGDLTWYDKCVTNKVF